MTPIFKGVADFALSEPIETYEYKTIVSIGLNGMEGRVSLRENPRFKYAFSFTMFPDSPFYEETLQSLRNPSLEYVVPLFQHKALATPIHGTGINSNYPIVPIARYSYRFNETNSFFDNGQFVSDDLEPFILEAGSNGFYYPTMKGFFVGESVGELITSELISTEVSFEQAGYQERINQNVLSPLTITPLDYPTLGGLPILENKANFSISPKVGAELVTETLDFGNLIKKEVFYEKQTIQYELLLYKEQILKFKQFIAYTKGRLNPFFVRDPNNGLLTKVRFIEDSIQIKYASAEIASVTLNLLRINN